MPWEEVEHVEDRTEDLGGDAVSDAEGCQQQPDQKGRPVEGIRLGNDSRCGLRAISSGSLRSACRGMQTFLEVLMPCCCPWNVLRYGFRDWVGALAVKELGDGDLEVMVSTTYRRDWVSSVSDDLPGHSIVTAAVVVPHP